MAVYGGITIDAEWWTADSESSPRARSIRYLQPHHTATTSLAGARSLMDPGGRTVSSNGLLGVDGTLYGVVPVNRRAFTSASTFDHDSFTVECVNSSGDPTWGLTDAQHRRLGQIAREIAALNGRKPGPDMIVPHNQVPGSYATACPGPSYNGALVLDYALASDQNGNDDMSIIYIAESASSDKVIPKGVSFIQEGGGPLRILSSSEYSVYSFYGKALPARVASWSGDAIRSITRSVGLTEWVGAPNIPADNVPVLTGRIIQGDPSRPEYPRVSGASGGSGGYDDSELQKQITELSNLIKGLPKPPTEFVAKQ